MVSTNRCSIPSLSGERFWASKQGKLSVAQSSWSAAGQRHKHAAEARYQAKSNVERNPPGSFNHRTQRYCTSRGVGVALMGTRGLWSTWCWPERPDGRWLIWKGEGEKRESLRSCSGSNHRITLRLLSTFSFISPWEKPKECNPSPGTALSRGEVHWWVSVRKHLQTIHLEWVSK